MNTGLTIITAEGVDTKILNRFLLSIRDWEFGSEGTWDCFFVAKSLDDIRTASDQSATIPPVQEFTNNTFEGTRFATIEGFMLPKHQAGQVPKLFIVLDDQGLAEETVILVERAVNIDDEGPLYKDYLNKVRIPWIEVHCVWTNLEIANMDFDEYCAEEYDYNGDWWTYKSLVGDDENQRTNERRFAAIKELEKLDLA